MDPLDNCIESHVLVQKWYKSDQIFCYVLWAILGSKSLYLWNALNFYFLRDIFILLC